MLPEKVGLDNCEGIVIIYLMRTLEPVNTSRSKNSFPIELRSNGSWFELDTALVLFVGIIMFTVSTLFFSARRLGGVTAQPVTNAVGAAGTSRQRMTCNGVVGCWKSDELIFRFLDMTHVAIEDLVSGEEIDGEWSLDEKEQVLRVRLTDWEVSTELIFSVDGRMLILSDRGESSFSDGLVLVKEAS